MVVKQHSSVKSKSAIFVLLIGILISILGYQTVKNNNQNELEQALAREADLYIDKVIKRFDLYQYGLISAKGALAISGENTTNRQAFLNYSTTYDIDAVFPGARGFGFIRRVPKRHESVFKALATADDWPNFTIKELSANSEERFVIQYIEPVERNLAAVGLDIASEKNRRDAAWKAVLTGSTQLSGPITLVQATGNSKQSFLILLPLYRGVLTPETIEDRIEKAYGWSYAPLIMEEVLNDLDIDSESIHLAIYDITENSKTTPFFDSELSQSLAKNVVLTQVSTKEIFGRQWQVDFSVKPKFVRGLHQTSPVIVLLIGLILSCLSAVIVNFILQSRIQKTRISQEQAKLASIVESSADGIISHDLDGKIISWNKGAVRIFGFEATEALGQLFTRFMVPKEFYETEEVVLRKVANREEVSHYNTVRVKKDGSPIDVSITISPILNEQNAMIGFSKTVRDISIQKMHEQHILELNNNLENLVKERTTELTAASNHLLMAAEMAELGIWKWSINENKLEWNNQMYRIYGYPLEELGKAINYEHWRSRLHPEDESKTVDLLNQAILGKADFNPNFRLLMPNGDVKIIQSSSFIQRDKEGNATLVTGINKDITSQVELETWLRMAKQNADETSKAKSNFLANMSHEIRTPMNAVLGMLQIIGKTSLTKRQNDYIEKATTAASSLLVLLNDILDYSKIDAGKLEIEKQEFKFETILQEVSVVLSGTQQDKDVEVLFDISLDGETKLIADSFRIQQILINLLSNAYKFTHQGTVILKVEDKPLDNNELLLTFSVTDTGIGISNEQIDKIFSGFSQAEASIARRFGGSGLGLVICKSLIEMMGGKLHVSSELGSGSCFSFSIKVAALANQFDSDSPAKKSLKVLVVDDNETARHLLTKTCERFDWQVDEASDGGSALALIKSHTTKNYCYDVVLVDWKMPHMSGINLVELVDSITFEDKRPIILMITAHAQEALAEINNLKKLSIVDILSKPVTPNQLFNTVNTTLEFGIDHHEKILTQPKKNKTLSNVNILVVEDNALNRQVAFELLKMEGALVSLAEGGIEGVEKVLSNPSLYDVVLMDMQMPDIDGLEATRRIRKAEKVIVPIIAMTANVSQDDIDLCIEAGMDGHLGKPIEIDKVVASIQQYIGQGDPEMLDLIDDELIILERFSHNHFLFEKVLGIYERDLVGFYETILAHQRNNESKPLLEKIHTLKGSSLTIGAKKAADQLKEMEQKIKTSGADYQDFETDFTALRNTIDISMNALEKYANNHH